jgi:deazaflavin-dependent oxidoreductase (nitroreductase family)
VMPSTGKELVKVADQKFIHLTAVGRSTGKPHTVELWFAINGARVYLSHEGKWTDWMKNVRKNGEVSFEIGGRHFVGYARWLEDHMEEAWAGKLALYEKYYGKAAKEVIKDWFSLSRLLSINPQ